MMGVTHLDAYSSLGTDALKRQALLVDEFVLTGTDWVREKWRKDSSNPLFARNESEIEFLIDQKVVIPLDWRTPSTIMPASVDLKLPRDLIWAVMARLDGPDIEAILKSKQTKPSSPGALKEAIFAMSSRLHADILTEMDIRAVALHDLGLKDKDKKMATSNALRLVVNQIPVPVADLPWQDIVALKAEEEFKHPCGQNNGLRLLSLQSRNWSALITVPVLHRRTGRSRWRMSTVTGS